MRSPRLRNGPGLPKNAFNNPETRSHVMNAQNPETRSVMSALSGQDGVNMAESRAGDVLFIKGQSGFGKSSILQYISQKYSDKYVWFLCGIGNCFDETKLQIKYLVWKQILKNFNDQIYSNSSS